ncbi:MAG: ATP-binding protein [Acidimicrobiaceae bacterium]|nr:ATP-binding protein [Acidimicrobiaceae bacterium]
MLLRFQVSNHRSILDPVELSMIAVDEDRPAARGFDLLSERVLTVAGIYGPNASGKSNVLDALAWLSSAVRESLRDWGEYIPRDPHRFSYGPTSPSAFEVDFVAEGVRHTYQLEVDDSTVQYESLCSYPERRQRMLFERHYEEINFRRGLRGVRGIENLLTPTTLALSAASRLGVPAISAVGQAISEMNAVGIRRRSRRTVQQAIFAARDNSIDLFFEENRGGNTSDYFSVSRQAALELLNFADPGIHDIEIVYHDDDGPHGSRSLLFLRQDENERVEINFDEESVGTQKWFHLLGPSLGALERGQILMFDEIETSLHPRLSARIIELFQDPRTNPRSAQLIFATHNPSLLNDLNRDEVWFTEKESDHTTRLIALAEYGGDLVRKSLNLERAYLQGRFGAIPDVDHIDVRDALEQYFQHADG